MIALGQQAEAKLSLAYSDTLFIGCNSQGTTEDELTVQNNKTHKDTINQNRVSKCDKQQD